MTSLTTPPRAIFRQIQANLADRYRSGFPVLKELIQNAEDAGATLIRFITHPGWAKANNPLLRVPGLLVANDGRFEEKDGRSILSFADSAKGDETAAIGRFGFGQKAVFHLCDSFVAFAVGHSVKFSAVINPCLNVIEKTRAASWDEIGPRDLELLQRAAAGVERGLLLWLPLRCDEVLPAPKLYFTDYRPSGAELIGDLRRHESDLCLILASMRHLDRVEVYDESTSCLELVRGKDAQRMAGPGQLDQQSSRFFAGTISGHAIQPRSYLGREVYGFSDHLKQLKQANDWPEVPVFTDEGEEMQPEKAEPHAAVVLIESKDKAAHNISLDWGVFLPVTKAVHLQMSEDVPGLRLMLHGYFFVDAGRRFIEGFDQEPDAEHSGVGRNVYRQWNETLRDDLLLPLLPAVLHDALQQKALSSAQLAKVVSGLKLPRFGQQHRKAIASQSVLAREVAPAAGGIAKATWTLLPPDCRLRVLPAPDERSQVPAAELFPELFSWAETSGVRLVAGPESTLTGSDTAWEPEEVKALLGQLTPEAFSRGGRISTLVEFLDAAVGSDDGLQEAAAQPLLSALRRALLDKRALASEEQIRAALAFLPQDCAIALPSSAGESRVVLRALAEVEGSLLCIRKAWLGDGKERKSLTPNEAAPLLGALAPLLRDERTADAAGAAAIALLRLLGTKLEQAARENTYEQLPVLRVGDGSGTARLVTLSDLIGASREERLFRAAPPVSEVLALMAKATPGTDALIVAGAAANILAEIGEPFDFAEAKNEAFAKLIGKADSFGPAKARAKLLDRIYTDAVSVRHHLRALAAGDKAAGHEQTRLHYLLQSKGILDNLALQLIAGSPIDFLIPAVVSSDLNDNEKSHLGLSDMDGERLGQLLTAHVNTLAASELSNEEISALLRSEIPDEDLRLLPIFPATDGQRYPANAVYRVTSEWPVPQRLKPFVPVLETISEAQASKRAKQLVGAWSPKAQIQVTLALPEAHQFWAEILQALEQFQDTPDSNLRGHLRKASWIPDHQGRVWSPEDILDLPGDVLTAARQLLPSNNERPLFLPRQEIAQEVRDALSAGARSDVWILNDLKASVAALLLMIEEIRPVALIAGSQTLPLDALIALARQGGDLGLVGWPLLAALLRANAKEDCEEGGELSALKPFFDAFGSVDSSDVLSAAAHLNALANLAEAGTAEAKTVYRSAFEQICSWPESALRQVMSKARAPTADGTWRPAGELAARVNGIASSHQLAKELEAFWPGRHASNQNPDIIDDQPVISAEPLRQATISQMESDCATSLERILLRSHSDVPGELLALLVGIIRQTEPYRSLVSKELALTDATIERIWNQIKTEIDAAFVSQLPGQSLSSNRRRTFLRFDFAAPSSVEVRSLSGDLVQLPVGALEPLLIIGDGHQRRRSVRLSDQDYWLRTVTVADVDRPVEAKQIAHIIQTIALECLGYQPQCMEHLDRLAQEYQRVEQATVEDARARLEDRLPQILSELKPARRTALRDALDEYDDGESALPPGKMRSERLPALKNKLWKALKSNRSTAELLTAVRSKIDEFGYNPDRALFELYQNADDAAAQHPPADRARFKLEISEGSISALHWGRQINHLGADPDLGQREGWHHDLFNMLLMNLSDKRDGVTGRFGLGFKSVHLLSADVGIASGFVACRVRGGMLPEVWDEGRRVSLDHVQDGRRATVIEIPFDPDCEAAAEAAIFAFRRAARWLPAMSRKLRQIEVVGVEPRHWAADFTDTDAPEIKIITFNGTEPGQALALKLSQEATLFFPLSGDGPEPAEQGVARLWLLAPLTETLASGWLLNGRHFRVDPGRGRLAGSEAERQAVFEVLGDALGGCLRSLHDLICRDWIGFAKMAGLTDTSAVSGPASFWNRLADLFSLDLDDPIACHLHRDERGYGRLVVDCAVLPTGLPQPFSSFLKASDARHVVRGALDDRELLTDLQDWQTIRDLTDSSVSPSTASKLTKLGFAQPTGITLAGLVRREFRTDSHISPERAVLLGRILNRERLKALPWDEKDDVLDAVSQGRFLMADGAFRAARLPPQGAKDLDQEERLILAFAPGEAQADRAYAGTGLALYRLAREQSGFQQTANTFADWAAAMSDADPKSAILRYVIEGRQGWALGELLAQKRPSWLPARSADLRSSSLVVDFDPDDLPNLFAALYPDEQRQRWAFSHMPGDEPIDDGSPIWTPEDFLEAAYAWWGKVASAERVKSDEDTYPEGFHPKHLRGPFEESDREGWFTFFALAIFQTISRTFSQQHRKFVADARRAGWWSDMAFARLPEEPEPWVLQLESFASPDAWRIQFPQWRRALTDLYALARWLPDYVDAFLTLPSVVRQQDHAIAMSDAWRLSASPIWQRRGLEGAPLTQSLGLGANWLVREAIRHGIWTEEDCTLMHPYGWASTARLRALFDRYLEHDLGAAASMDISPDIYEFVESYLGDRASFLGDLDLPLQIIADGRRNDVLPDNLRGVASDLGNDANSIEEED